MCKELHMDDFETLTPVVESSLHQAESMHGTGLVHIICCALFLCFACCQKSNEMQRPLLDELYLLKKYLVTCIVVMLFWIKVEHSEESQIESN